MIYRRRTPSTHEESPNRIGISGQVANVFLGKPPIQVLPTFGSVSQSATSMLDISKSSLACRRSDRPNILDAADSDGGILV